MDRRRVLGALGGSAAMGLAGCVFTEGVFEDDDGNGENATQNESTIQNESPSQNTSQNNSQNESVAPASLAVNHVVPAETIAVPGESVEVTAFLENRGDREATQTVELTLGDQSRTQDVTVGPDNEQSVTVDAGVGSDWSLGRPVTFEIDTEGFLGTYEYAVSTDDDQARGEVRVRERGADEFVARSTDGWLWLGLQDRAEIRDTPFAPVSLPPTANVSAPVTVVGRVDDGTWQSRDVAVPSPLRIPPPFEFDIGTPAGFAGRFDPDSGQFSFSGPVRIDVSDSWTGSITFSVGATTGESGDLRGAFDREGDTATVTAVDNQFTVEDAFGDGALNGLLGLPATEPGANWFSMTLELALGENL
jgi:hypothetical protein